MVGAAKQRKREAKMLTSKVAIFIYGLMVGGFVGFLAAAICAASGMASRCEECMKFNQENDA